MGKKGHEIPMFSARVTRRMGTGFFVFAALFVLFDFVGLEKGKMLLMVGMIPCIIIYWYLSRVMRRCVWKLQENCIKEVGLTGSREIPYEEITEALRIKKIMVTTSSFKMPKRRGYISFHYEVGNPGLQKEIKESYQFLTQKVPVEFPKLTQTVIQQMDRSFFYKKDRRSSSIVMILSGFTMLLYNIGPVLCCIVVVGLGQFIQYLMLNELFKGIYFGKKVEEKIQKTFVKFPDVRVRRMWVSYVQMAVVVLLTALMNLFMLTK